MLSALLTVVGCALADENPPDAYYMGPGGADCPGNDNLKNIQDCKDAVQVLKHTRMNKVVNSAGRPIGCFWDSNGGLYFNQATENDDKVWGGVGPVCKRRGTPFLKLGEMTANDDKYESKQQFGDTVWITQATAKKQKEVFFPDDGGCPVDQEVWFHKEYDGSEEMAGPWVIKDCNKDDRGLYQIKLNGNLNVGGRTYPTKFYMKDVIYISKFECKNKECTKPLQYQKGECTGPSNDKWTCEECDNIACDRFTEYRTGLCNQKAGNGFKCNPQPTCGPGQYYNGGGKIFPPPKGSCNACPEGTFRADDEHREANCAKWSTECDTDMEHETQAPSATQNRICATSTECAADQYESKPKSDDTDRECTGITECTAGQFISKEATDNSDSVCADCDGVAEFTDKADQSSCSTMKQCDAGEYVSTLGSASSDLVCSDCDEETYQSAVDHREPECTPQPFCGPGTKFAGPNKYMISKTEEIVCEECESGKFMAQLEHRETRCQSYSTRSCGKNEMMIYVGLLTQDAECVGCPDGQHQPDFYHKNTMCEDTTSTSTRTTSTKTRTTRTTTTETSITDTSSTETSTSATETTVTETTVDSTDNDTVDNDNGDGDDGAGDNDAGDDDDGDDDDDDDDRDSSAGASTGGKPTESPSKQNSAATTTGVVIVVAALVVALIVGVAVFKVRQNGGGGVPAAAFENPMYDQAGPAFDAAYVDPQQQGGGGGGGGYMDVNPAQQQQASSGYMDVGGSASHEVDLSDGEEV